MTTSRGVHSDRAAPPRTGGRVCDSLRGSALLDVVLAVVVLSVSLLASMGVIRRGQETAVRSRWILLAVSATRDVVDSLGLAGAQGGGSRTLPPVTVRWSAEGGHLFRFEAFVPDTTGPPRLVIHADLPMPPP